MKKMALTSANFVQTKFISMRMADNPHHSISKHGGLRPGAGRPKKGETREPKNRVRNTNLKPRGTCHSYVIARLVRDGFAELAAQVRAGKLSAYAAASLAFGWARHPENLPSEPRRRPFDPCALIG